MFPHLSPHLEFDDLEMCTSLSHHQDCEGVSTSWYAGNCNSNRDAYKMEDESASLQGVIRDLRSQLTRCHKVIRGLQLRVRSLSATSDYASSLERTPRKVQTHNSILAFWSYPRFGMKPLPELHFSFVVAFQVNWAFETSPAPSGAEEDEGWMSDTQGHGSSSRPSRELQQLMERVASLEAQLKSTRAEEKGQAEEGKCATWPG